MDRPHSHRLRLGRHSEPGRIYLLTTVTHQRSPLFADFHAGRLVVRAMRQRHRAGDVSSLAFVVMPDHVHWLIELGAGCTLAALMRTFKSYTARELNVLHNQPDRCVWQPGYQDHALRKEEDVQAVARYLVANPLRAGLAQNIGDYPLWDAIWL
jgi:REP element-mobilizing transposase RayT